MGSWEDGPTGAMPPTMARDVAELGRRIMGERPHVIVLDGSREFIAEVERVVSSAMVDSRVRGGAEIVVTSTPYYASEAAFYDAASRRTRDEELGYLPLERLIADVHANSLSIDEAFNGRPIRADHPALRPPPAGPRMNRKDRRAAKALGRRR